MTTTTGWARPAPAPTQAITTDLRDALEHEQRFAVLHDDKGERQGLLRHGLRVLIVNQLGLITDYSLHVASCCALSLDRQNRIHVETSPGVIDWPGWIESELGRAFEFEHVILGYTP